MERSFNTSIGIKDFVEWKDTFNIFIEHSYGNLEKAAEKQKKVFSLGYSFNPKFSENWNQDHSVGVAGVFDRKIMVISQPSFPGMEIWSPVDEALTIVHELGHSLGAVHVSDSNSIMYPAIGRAGFDFDSLNTRILTITLNELDFDETKRLISYLSLMNSFFLSKFISEEACCVYSLGAMNVFEQFAGMKFINEDPIITNNTVTQYISEDSFRWTLLGYIYLKAGYYNQSVYCSEKALEVNPSLKIPAEGIKVSKKWIEFLKKPN
ncbi:MAG: matrixin family metalloprotease [Bacteroidetes bacterium]|nr:matrixin family metalloprotease [Bacteroidota bacterium]